MRKGESKYDGEIMKRISKLRWKLEGGKYGRITSKMIDDILNNAKYDLLKGSPQLSPQTIRWLEKWFGWKMSE